LPGTPPSDQQEKIICPDAGVTYPAQEERIPSRRTSRGRIMYMYRKKNYKIKKKSAGHGTKIKKKNIWKNIKQDLIKKIREFQPSGNNTQLTGCVLACQMG
jgi:hypothetical protein